MARLLDSSVAEVMISPVVTVHPECSVRDAIRIMGRRHIGSLVVVVSDKLRGILTERDLLEKVLYPEKDPMKLLVEEVMNPQVRVVDQDISVREATKIMLKENMRLIVEEESRVVGIVTASDLVRALSKRRIMGRRLKEFMVKDVVTISKRASIRDAIRLMMEKRVGSVIVTKDKHPYGIFAERDLMTKVLAKEINLETRLERLASHPLIYESPTATIQKAARLMVNNKIRRLPVMRKEKLVGIVTATDLVKEIATHLR